MFTTGRSYPNYGKSDEDLDPDVEFDSSFSSSSSFSPYHDNSFSSDSASAIDEEKMLPRPYATGVSASARRRRSQPPSSLPSLNPMSSSTPRTFKRKLAFFAFTLVSLAFLVSLRSHVGTLQHSIKTHASTLPYFLPESWNNTASDSPLSPYSLDEAEQLEQSLSLIPTQEEMKSNLDTYFDPKPMWGHHTPNREDYKFHTDSKLRELAVCVATNTCRENQTSVIIYGYIHAHFHIYDGYMGGEGIWTMYMTETLEKWGYTILHARDDWQYIWYIYSQIPDMVKGILAYPTGQYGPFTDVMKSKKFGDGIPAWKYFPYYYFPDHYRSVVGDAWNIHSELGYSEQQRNFTFIPYIVEEAQSPPYVPAESRPNQVYIMAKYVRYFYKGAQPAWEDTSFFSRAKAELELEFPGFEFIVGCKDDRNKEEQAKNPMPVPEGVRNIGQMDKVEFERQLANSRALLGIGWPTISPSPHIALSYGIPFVSPYSMHGWSSYDKPETWAQSQHNTLRGMKEPYVYHVLRNDYDSFVNGIRQALSTPIDKFRLPYYTREYHETAVSKWLSTDWEGKARDILDQRKKGVETQHGDAVLEFLM